MMAGMAAEDVLDKLPRCPHHGNGCAIKTGTGAQSYGKSFFICNNVKERCSFSRPAENVEKTECHVHNQMVELKSFAMKADGLRCYYRCIYGKENGGGWCGNVKVGGKKKVSKLKDITNCPDKITRDQQAKMKRDIDITRTDQQLSEAPVLLVQRVHTTTKKTGGTDTLPDKNPTQSSQLAASNPSKEKIYHEPAVVTHQFFIPTNASTTDVLEKDKTAVQKELHPPHSPFSGNSPEECFTASVYDASRNAFQIPRNARISDISETSSHDSSTSSSASAVLSNSDAGEAAESPSASKVLSNTIEIISSGDESDGDHSADINSDKYCQREKLSNADDGDLKIKSGIIEDLEMKIRKQKDLLQRIGPVTKDNGQKLKDDISRLTQMLEQAKIEQKSTLHNFKQPSTASVKITDKFPSMGNATGGVKKDFSLSSEQKSVINLGFDVPNIAHESGDMAAAMGRLAPVFGGRMTEKRLKEVGRMTKEAIEHLHKSLDTCPTPTEECEDPEKLKVKLMTHQRQALAWLLWRETQTPSGGILADDMGLGKTLTMISLTLKSKQKDLAKVKEVPKDSDLIFSKCTLIVCPASLVHQWYKEIENRVEKMQLRVCLYHGSNRENKVRKLAGYDIILTTYNIVSIEGKPFVQQEKEKSSKPALTEWIDTKQPTKSQSGPIFKLFWRRIILDEGHTIKNYKTNISIAVSSLDAESRWIVTGTPIQNQTMDLYSLIKFLRVSPFDELKFWKHEVDNKTASGRKRMTSIVNSLLLRRTKDQTDAKTGKPLVSLPKRSCVLHKLKLSKSETDVYELVQSFSKNMFTQFLDTRKESGGHPSKQPTKMDNYEMPEEVLGMKVDQALTVLGLRGINAVNAGCLLVLVLRLRQCCSHMSLMCEALDSDLCKTEGIDIPLEEQLGNMSIVDECGADNSNFRPKELKTTFQSTKVTALLEKLKELQKESQGKKPIKSVIVSQWTRMLDLIAYHLKRNGFKFDFITGSVNAKKRADIVESFNSEGDPQVMLVSLKAGGVGLNLIGGSHLFLIDQHWNPSLEDQACDRVYRVGQQNDVVIHRFLCLNTVEERIVQLQEKKKALANSVLYGGKTQKLSLDDLKTIFGITR